MAAQLIATVGQGFARPNYETAPIDIHLAKLLEWLVDRKRTTADWFKRSQAIQQRMQELRPDLSALPGTATWADMAARPILCYEDCVAVVEALKQCDGGVNMLNQYTSSRLKQWIQVQRAYEKDGVYLGETASRLVQLAVYDSPALKKQIGHWQQQIKDLGRRDSEHKASSAAYKTKYDQTCRDLGIRGENVALEVSQLVLELPTVYDQIIQSLRSPEMTAAITYYQAFVSFIRKGDAQKEFPALLRTLQFLRDHGNPARALAEETFGLPRLTPSSDPSAATRQAGEAQVAASMRQAITPTIASSITAPSEEPAIDWDVPTAPSEETANETDIRIDWDVDVGVGQEGDQVADNANATAEADDDAGWTIEVEGAGQFDGTSALDDERVRGLLLSDLLELQAFVGQRVAEHTARDDIIALQLFQTAPPEVGLQNGQSLSRMHADVTRVFELLQGPRSLRLFQLQSSRRYSERLTESLQQMLRLSKAMLERINTNAAKRVKLQEQIEEGVAAIGRNTTEVQLLKAQIQSAISKLYDHRPVNIVGEFL